VSPPAEPGFNQEKLLGVNFLKGTFPDFLRDHHFDPSKAISYQKKKGGERRREEERREREAEKRRMMKGRERRNNHLN
jgi:hypothetical protein